METDELLTEYWTNKKELYVVRPELFFMASGTGSAEKGVHDPSLCL